MALLVLTGSYIRSDREQKRFLLLVFGFPAWRSNAELIVHSPSRQWDYPYGKPLFNSLKAEKR